MSNSLRTHGLWPTKLLCPWDSPDKNTGVGCQFIFPGDLPDPGIEPRSPAFSNLLFVEFSDDGYSDQFEVIPHCSFNLHFSECLVTQSCPTLFDPVDCSLPGFSVHGILQARILEWVTISFSKLYNLIRIVYTLVLLLLLSRFSRVRLCATP